jgi:hypothetical protein
MHFEVRVSPQLLDADQRGTQRDKKQAAPFRAISPFLEEVQP